MIKRTCENDDCSKEFEVKYKSSPKRFCSLKCAKKGCGGYREGSGRAKTGYYKGIYCGSTYELAWVIYQIDHNKEFKRFDTSLEWEGKKYYPDFIQDGKIIEIKGYESIESVDKKTFIANKNGYEVVVLRKPDLQVEFDWVKNNYSKRLEELYDNYKPKYEYICAHCNTKFSKSRKATYEKVYCSRSCSLKGNRRSKNDNSETYKKISETLTGKSPALYKRKHKQQWITNGIVSTRIRFDENIPNGFRRGRTTSHDAAGVATSPSN